MTVIYPTYRPRIVGALSGVRAMEALLHQMDSHPRVFPGLLAFTPPSFSVSWRQLFGFGHCDSLSGDVTLPSQPSRPSASTMVFAPVEQSTISMMSRLCPRLGEARGLVGYLLPVPEGPGTPLCQIS